MAAVIQPQSGQFPTVYISFSAEINAHTTESLIAVFANEINQGKRDFYLMLSTPGGSVMNGLNLYNVLRGLPITLTTHNVGNVDSIGNAVFLAGQTRYACPHSTFMFHGDSEEHLWFDFLLKTAMREQELMHTSWSDINFGHSSVFVRYKPEYGFSPKTYRERQIPIPKKLTQELKEFKSKSDKTCGLVFPTAGCRPKLNFLDCCKVIAKRAGLAPANWWLHKFRATAATRMLQKGIDLKSVQRFLGHKDIESTMRYLAAQQNDVLQKRVEEVW